MHNKKTVVGRDVMVGWQNPDYIVIPDNQIDDFWIGERIGIAKQENWQFEPGDDLAWCCHCDSGMAKVLEVLIDRIIIIKV